MPWIRSYTRINRHGILGPGKDLAVLDPTDISGVSVYQTLGLNYPKFHKMDLMGKWGILGSHLVLKGLDSSRIVPATNTAVVLSNASSSTDTDLKYLETISNPEQYFPSPQLFVYTLPNIVIGEICIRNKWQGENAFFISETFQPELLYHYGQLLFQSTDTQHLLIGWLEVTSQKLDLVFYFVEKEKTNSECFSNFEFHSDELKRIYDLLT